MGSDIRADMANLATSNSISSRIWDLLNTNLIKNLKDDCTVLTTNRYRWQMMIIFEKNTQCIFTFMREKRFAQLCRLQYKRKYMHYIDMMAKQFNSELMPEQEQLTLFSHTFLDENRLVEKVQKLLRDLKGGISVVQNHVLILFDTMDYQLSSIRAVMVTPNLDIAQGCSQDWSKYISADEGVVVERVIHPEAPENHPNRGLALTKKSLERKQNNLHQKEAAQTSETEQ